MKTVNISNLKARLSSYIKRVQKGEELLVCHRNTPGARIVPWRMEGYSEQEQRLIASGIMTPPLKRRPASFRWPRPTGKTVPDDVMAKVWKEEREDR